MDSFRLKLPDHVPVAPQMCVLGLFTRLLFWYAHNARSLVKTVDGRITIFSNLAQNHPPLRVRLQSHEPAKPRLPKLPHRPVNPLARPPRPLQSISRHPLLHTNHRSRKKRTMILLLHHHDPILRHTCLLRQFERTTTLSVVCSSRHSRSSSHRHSRHCPRWVS